MKVTAGREALLKPLQAVIGVVERRQTMPILANVLVVAKNGEVAITATDLEVELVANAAVQVDSPGEVTVPGRKLLDICRALPDDAEISIGQSGEKLIIKSGRSKFSLTTLPAAEFPTVEDINAGHSIEVSQEVLARLLDKTHFSMAQQDVRYYLNGLLLETGNSVLRAVATDGHRLALSEAALEDSSIPEQQVIVPRKGVLELQRLMSGEGDLTIELGSNHVRIQLDGIRFTSKLIDGRFPEYERVIPQDTSNSMVADKGVFKGALQRTAILSNEKYRGIRLIIRQGNMVLQAHNPEQEEAEEELEIEYSGDEIEIGFNVNYLLDALGAIEADEVNLAVVDGNSSCLLRDPGTIAVSTLSCRCVCSRLPLKTFKATDFRCLESAGLEFSEGNNLIYGPNASGKTSILEAIGYLGRARSFRGAGVAELVRHGAREFILFGKADTGSRVTALGIRNGRDGLEVHVDGEKSSSAAPLAEALPLQVIDPDVHELIAGGPENRRRYIDWVAFHVEQPYLEAWRRYRRALKQRNAALKSGDRRADLESWDKELAELGLAVDAARQRMLDISAPGLEELGEAFLGSEVSIEYARGWSADKELLEALRSGRERDYQLGSTQAGPHRGDLKLRYDERQARKLVSRGQQKLLACAMILAATEVVQTHLEKPLTLLIDDPAAELDSDSLTRLMVAVANLGCQVVATTLELDKPLFHEEPALFHVEQGQVAAVN